MENNQAPHFNTFAFSLDWVPPEQIVGAPNIFNEGEIEKIIELGRSNLHGTGLIPGAVEKGENKEVRNCSLSYFYSNHPETNWIFGRIREAVIEANTNFYRYDLTSIQTLQFTEYREGEYYNKHVDTNYNMIDGMRKLSFTVLLSDDKDYEGGDLKFHLADEPGTATRDRGSIHLFPSFVMHEVTPVTRGVRYSLVGWVSGPPFK